MNGKIRKYNEGDHIILRDTDGIFRAYQIFKDHNDSYTLLIDMDLKVLQGN